MITEVWKVVLNPSYPKMCSVFQTCIVFVSHPILLVAWSETQRTPPYPPNHLLLLVNWGLLFQQTVGHGPFFSFVLFFFFGTNDMGVGNEFSLTIGY